MNRIRTWFLFHKPERHYHKLSYSLVNTSHLLNKLNNRRRSIQREIYELSENSGNTRAVCEKCQGACCKGEYDHFTIIDFLIRSFSETPLAGYGDIWKPKSFCSLIFGQILASQRKEINVNLTHGCPHLGNTGCNIEVEERPIRCILWTCRDFREAIPHDNLIKIGRLIKELDLISNKVVNLFK